MPFLGTKCADIFEILSLLKFILPSTLSTNPIIDFNVNATGTLNLLELTKKYCFESPFIFMSTNKVYGDNPNNLPLIEKSTRWEIKNNHSYKNGITESMSIDNCIHSFFGASKCYADLAVQEYGKNIGLKTVCFRAGCITGPNHSGARLHGLSLIHI